jgi:thioredoxin
MALLNVTDATFESSVLQSNLPVVVDFYADWCQPCRAIAPILEDLAAKYDGHLHIAKVDVERNPAIAQAFRVQSIPMLAFVRGGQVVDIQVGALDAGALDELVRGFVGPVSSGGVETWDADRVKLALEIDEVVPVDLRGAGDYKRAHLPRAINVPAAELADRIGELGDPTKRYVFYLRTDAEVESSAKLAAEAGVNAVILEGGLLVWEVEIGRIERG